MLETFPDELVYGAEEKFFSEVRASDDLVSDISFQQAFAHDNPLVSLYQSALYEFDDSQKIERKVWEDNFSREGTEWFDGMTTYQAKVVMDEHDHEAKYNRIMDSVDGWNVTSLKSYFLGSLVDPLNYLPWTGVFAKSLMFLKIGQKAKTLSKLPNLITTKNRGLKQTVGDAMIGSSIGEGAISLKRDKYQLEYDWTMAALNIGMASGAGALLAGFSKVAQNIKGNDVLSNISQASKAVDDFSRGKQVEVDGSAFDKLKSIYDKTWKEPIEKFKNIFKKEAELLAEQPEFEGVVKGATKILRQGKEEIDTLKKYINCKMS